MDSIIINHEPSPIINGNFPWDFPQQWPLIPWDFPTAPQGPRKTRRWRRRRPPSAPRSSNPPGCSRSRPRRRATVERRPLRGALPLPSKKGRKAPLFWKKMPTIYQNFECKPKGLVMFGDVWFTYSRQVQANQKV